MVRTPGKTKPLSDEFILKSIDEAYTKLNFTGLVGWHYYNEPMLEYKRIFSLMESYPKGRYVLWTNGTIQPKDDRINLFEQVYCTDYTGKVNRDYYKGCKKVSVFSPNFDDRLNDNKDLPGSTKHCMRQHIEFIIDYWGTVHLCCQDWRGEVKIGNIWEDSFTSLVTKRHEILEQMSRNILPERCVRCRAKAKNLPKFDEKIYNRTIGI